jgi:hypothetical protein
MAPPAAPRPQPAALAVEDDETRALREKVEAFEARDQDGMEADLKRYSDAFHENIRALELENDPPKNEPASFGASFSNHNDAFIGTVCASRKFVLASPSQSQTTSPCVSRYDNRRVHFLSRLFCQVR